MSLTLLPAAPPLSKQAVPIVYRRGLVTFDLPEPNFFIGDIEHWEAMEQEGKRGGREFLRHVGSDFSEALGSIMLDGVIFDDHLSRNPSVSPAFTNKLLVWMRRSMNTMALSRFLREPSVGSLVREATIGYRNMDIRTLSKFALHLEDDQMRMLNIQPLKPWQSRWYEGTSMYVQATKPAEQSKPHKQDHPLNPSNFTTLIPVLKREVWAHSLDMN